MFDVYCYKKIDFSATKKLDAFSTKAALYLIYTHNMYDWENIWQKGSGHDDLLRLRDELRLTALEVMLEVMYVSVEKSQTFVLKYETMLQEHG